MSQPNNDAPASDLSFKALEEELLRLYKDDEEFRPLLTLLAAAKGEVANAEDAIEKAIEEILMLNRRDNPAGKMLPPPRFEPSSEVKEGDGHGALYVNKLPFQNWGDSINHSTSSTWQIRTRVGVKNLVVWAAKNNKRVRVAGFRHSWTDIFGANDDVIIMLQPYNSLVNLPYQAPDPKDWDSDLNQIIGPIESVGPHQRTSDAGHAFYKIGAAVINEDFRQWCFDKKLVCIPMNVIMVEVTFGGTNAPVCHGSGFGTKTLSDLVVEVEYVDAKGNIQIVNDPEELKVASGCFGLLGVVTSLTLQLEDMMIAELAPAKVPIILAIPPPAGYKVPKEVDEMSKGITPKQIDDARKEFIRRCENDYYLEWFWFPYQSDCWVNTWTRRTGTPQEKALIKTYPGDGFFTGVKAQALEGTIAETIVNFTKWFQAVPRLQAFIFGFASMAALPHIKPGDKPIDTLQSDALHFRRGVQNFRVWDTEWEIPIPGKGGKRDYETIQHAWWDAITEMYANPKAPVRVTLEMRLTGGSDVLLAPQRGNHDFGSASIEVLTTLTTPPEIWKAFQQTMADKWTNYKDENGNYLNARPHWAKQWEGLTVRGKPIHQYLREEAYADVIPPFRQTFEKIVTGRGGTVQDTRARFGNKLIEGFIFE